MASTAPHLALPRQTQGIILTLTQFWFLTKYPQPAVTPGPSFNNQINLVIIKYICPGSTLGNSGFIGLGWSFVSWSLINWTYVIGWETLLHNKDSLNARNMCPDYFSPISLRILFNTGLQADSTNSEMKFISHLCYPKRKRQISSIISPIKPARVCETSPRCAQ